MRRTAIQVTRRVTGRIAGVVPLWALHRLIPRTFIGVFYHLVSETAPPHVKHLYPHRSIEDFESDLRFFKERYRLLSYRDLVAELRTGQQGRTPGIFLSFDDGFAECFTNVAPLLLRYEVPCTFFLTTNFIDNRAMYYRNKVSLCIERVLGAGQGERKLLLAELNRAFSLSLESEQTFAAWIKGLIDEDRIAEICELLGVDVAGYLTSHRPYLSREQIKTLIGQGFTIGAHSQRHQKLIHLDKAGIEQEIAGSCAIIQDLTGADEVPFSFPNSAFGLDRDLLARIRDKHREVGLLFDTKDLNLDREFIINRIWAEAPKFSPDGRSPMAAILRRAYQGYLTGALLRGGGSMLDRQNDANEASL